MILDSAKEITNYLARHRWFGECLLNDVRWQHYGTIIEMEFDYIWTTSGIVRPASAPPNLKVLRFHSVLEAHLWNELTEYMLLNPGELDWGLSEVAAVRLEEDPSILERYRGLPTALHHVACRWESKRRLEIVFGSLEAE